MGLAPTGNAPPYHGAHPRRTFYSEFKRSVVDHFLHDEESTYRPYAWQGNELLAMQPIEIGDVANSDLEKVVEVSGHQVAIEHKRQFGDCVLELGETRRR